MNGYLRIKNTDLYERDGVTYWRNGGNIIGNVVKAVIEENDVVTSETYYIESLKTAKAIMLDPDIKIGGLTASESKNGNFIIVTTEPADFTEYGGGAGIKITFIYGVNYYSIETVESNGDIKIYDPDGESGTITPDALPDTAAASAGDALVLDSDKKPVWVTPASAKKYLHTIRITKYNTWQIVFNFIDDSSTPYTKTTLHVNLPTTDLLCSAVGIDGDHIYNACMAHKGSSANSVTVSRYLDYNKADNTYTLSSGSMTVYYTGTADTISDSVKEI